MAGSRSFYHCEHHSRYYLHNGGSLSFLYSLFILLTGYPPENFWLQLDTDTISYPSFPNTYPLNGAELSNLILKDGLLTLGF